MGIADWRRDGFLIFAPGIAANTVSAASEFTRAIDGNRQQDAWRSVPAVREIALDPGVLGMLRMLYEGRRPIPFQTLNFPRGTQQAVHSDTVHFDTDPPGWMAGVWVALEDVHPDSGPLVYYPGSHRLPVHRMESFGLQPKREYYPIYEQAMANVVAVNRLQPAYATIRRGECLIWAANLLHGGSPILNPSLSRRSQVTHYFFEQPGVRFLTPLLGKSRSVSEIQ